MPVGDFPALRIVFVLENENIELSVKRIEAQPPPGGICVYKVIAELALISQDVNVRLTPGVHPGELHDMLAVVNSRGNPRAQQAVFYGHEALGRTDISHREGREEYSQEYNEKGLHRIILTVSPCP
jgi:hypothetical protein